MDEINNPHDVYFRESFTRRRSVHGLLGMAKCPVEQLIPQRKEPVSSRIIASTTAGAFQTSVDP
ncbi:hypothetical protein [Halochromatium roseum]|uniref:hypothetical protein n=1 Tax=Halochromatium roseum TaxID=391920 RepID=UPI00191296D0|nr:hypothetical protein [Halochromatium roseum]MBK5939406.1 hypothetical protein [Halochromatium roseum]